MSDGVDKTTSTTSLVGPVGSADNELTGEDDVEELDVVADA